MGEDPEPLARRVGGHGTTHASEADESHASRHFVFSVPIVVALQPTSGILRAIASPIPSSPASIGDGQEAGPVVAALPPRLVPPSREVETDGRFSSLRGRTPYNRGFPIPTIPAVRTQGATSR